jgi:hypothetical protein
MRRTLVVLAAAILAAAVGVIFAGTASANHRCVVRVGTTPQGPASQLDARRSLEASVGETVFVYFYEFDPGPATIEWLVDGKPEEAKRRVFTVPPDTSEPEGPGPVAGMRGSGFGVTLQASDVGTVTLRPSQPPAVGQRACGDGLTPSDPVTIEVARSRMPDTATRDAAMPVSQGVPEVLFPLAGLAALLATHRAWSVRRRSRAPVGGEATS